MPEDYSNIYKIARRAAGYTQEAAAEQLNISIESVRAYETYQRTRPLMSWSGWLFVSALPSSPTNTCTRQTLSYRV